MTGSPACPTQKFGKIIKLEVPNGDFKQLISSGYSVDIYKYN